MPKLSRLTVDQANRQRTWLSSCNISARLPFLPSTPPDHFLLAHLRHLICLSTLFSTLRSPSIRCRRSCAFAVRKARQVVVLLCSSRSPLGRGNDGALRCSGSFLPHHGGGTWEAARAALHSGLRPKLSLWLRGGARCGTGGMPSTSWVSRPEPTLSYRGRGRRLYTIVALKLGEMSTCV